MICTLILGQHGFALGRAVALHLADRARLTRSISPPGSGQARRRHRSRSAWRRSCETRSSVWGGQGRVSASSV